VQQVENPSISLILVDIFYLTDHQSLCADSNDFTDSTYPFGYLHLPFILLCLPILDSVLKLVSGIERVDRRWKTMGKSVVDNGDSGSPSARLEG
jgi:hypothetical protein